MSTTKLTPNDDRVERKTAQVNGVTYAYLHAKPTGTPRGNLVLVHGFPDFSFGWRNQIPFFQSKGYQVIAPDMLGYGGTDAPEAVERYSLKNTSDDMAALCASILGPEEQIILGGHDWGGYAVWRVAIWHPKLIRGVFSVCTPYIPPSPVFVDLPDLIKAGKLLNFEYQLQFRSGDIEKHTQTRDGVKDFIKAASGARGPNGEVPFSSKGIDFSLFGKLGKSPLYSEEELEAYTDAFYAKGLRGPTNWYRIRQAVFDEERPLVEGGQLPRFAMPSLVIAASKDVALPPVMMTGMEKHFDDLTKKEVNTNHFATVEAPELVNNEIQAWIEEKVEGASKASL